MLRLIHSQTVSGAILVDDIDDGLPNKNVHRLGSTADPKAYERDGYANKPKQPVYVPPTKATNTALPGYIDVMQTPRVNLSAASGKISKLSQAGLISVVSFVESDLATPVVTNAQLGVPGAGDLTLTGTGLTSLTPDYTSVELTGVGAITLIQGLILAAVGGVVSDTSIVIPAALVPGIAAPGTAALVIADDKRSNAFSVV